MRIERHHLAWILASATTVACFLGATAYTQDRLARLDTLASTLETNAVPSIEYLGTSGVALTKLNALLDDLNTSPAPDQREAIRQQARAQQAALRADVAKYLALPPLPGEQAFWLALRTDVDRAATAVADVLDRRSDVIDARTQYERADDAVDRAARSVLATLDFDARQAEAMARNVQSVRTFTLRTIVGLDAASAVVAMVAVWLAYRASQRHDALLDAHTSLLAARVDELDTFAGRVAHDVLSPLGTVATALSLLAKSADDRALRYIDRSQRALLRVQQLVDGLLAFARSGARPDGTERCAVDAVVSSIATELVEAARERDIVLTVDVEEVWVACSVGVITSVVQNLARNAIKYMGPSVDRRIEVRVGATGTDARIEVADTGPGIPAPLRARIFEPFVRGSHDGVQGSGLGLATVRRLVESHGGRVGVTPRPGGGSLFGVTLPLSSPPR